MINKQQQHRQKDRTVAVLLSLSKSSPLVNLLSLLKFPLVKCLSKGAPLVNWLSLWKCPLVNCLSKSATLVDWLSLQKYLLVICLSESDPSWIVSSKINPYWLTVYFKCVPSSIKQQRSMHRKCRIWEQQNEHTSIQIKQSDFELYSF